MILHFKASDVLKCWIRIFYFALILITQADSTVANNIIGTEPYVKLQDGTEGSLPCQLAWRPLGVQWSRGSSFSEREPIIFLDLNSLGTAFRSGEGYDDGLYNITDDFSLIIFKVNLRNEGQYVCEAIDYQTNVFSNQTTLEVYALPDEPYPIINNCLNDMTAQIRGQNCTLYEKQYSHDITCTVNGYTPNIMMSLYFRHDSRNLTNQTEEEWWNDEMTMGKSVTILANASFWQYECVAVGSAEVNERSATILVRDRPTMSTDQHDRLKEIGYILVLFGVWCFFPLAIFGMIESQIMRLAIGEGDIGHILYTIFLTLLVIAVPFTMIIFGIIYKADCPADENIPIYLIVMGSLLIWMAICYFFWIYQNVVKDNIPDYTPLAFVLRCVCLILVSAIMGTFITGNVWIFRIYPPNMSEPTSLKYCNPTLYYFSIVITDTYILVVLIFFTIVAGVTIYFMKRELEQIYKLTRGEEFPTGNSALTGAYFSNFVNRSKRENHRTACLRKENELTLI